MGDALECFIKDIFSEALNENDLSLKNKKYSETFSYIGNQNNPPDIILKNGDAIEVKKIESLKSGIALNSSYPKAKLYSDEPMITNSCRNCEDWQEKNIIYTIGVVKDKKLQLLWLIYGDCYAADREILSTIQHSNLQIPTASLKSSTQIIHDSHDVDTRSQQFTDYIIHYLKNNLSDISHTALVISPTKHIIKQIHEHLSLHFKEQGITLLSQDISGSKGKIVQLLETNESPTILVCTNHFLLKFQPELANLEKAILTKLPIGLPAHKIYRILEKEDDNSFGNLVIPQTAATIRHILDLLQNKYNQKISF